MKIFRAVSVHKFFVNGNNARAPLAIRTVIIEGKVKEGREDDHAEHG